MKSYENLKYIFNEVNELKTSTDIENWVNSLSVPKRKPQNISKVEHNVILKLKSIIDNSEYKDDPDFRDTLILQTYNYLRLPKEQYDLIYAEKNNQAYIIKGKYAIYKKNDVRSYTRFLENIDNIESFLSTLKGYHRIPLKNLTVEFVSNREMSVPAQYKTNKNVIWINPSSKKIGNTLEEYGSLRYIMLHELGHKFLEQKPQKWNISDPILYTTPYSKKNLQTLREEEVFAELFALSHWKKKYKQYKKQIDIFEGRLQV